MRVLTSRVLFAAILITATTLFAQDAAIIGGPATYVVKDGDTVTSIAARHAVSTQSILDLNTLQGRVTLTAGQQLRIDNTHIALGDPGVAITINVPQRLLFFRDGETVTAYPITVGRRAWPTPRGPFTVVEKEINPAWDVPVSIQREMERQGKPVVTRMEPGPGNPLGAHWLRLSLPGIGIHGTNAPSSIYRFGSHGCIRMHPDDIASLFPRIAVGARGVIVYQPILIALLDDRIWLEANRDEYRLAPDRFAYVRAVAEQFGLTTAIDWTIANRVLAEQNGRAYDVSTRTWR